MENSHLPETQHRSLAPWESLVRVSAWLFA
jgi:hypothetical protein